MPCKKRILRKLCCVRERSCRGVRLSSLVQRRGGRGEKTNENPCKFVASSVSLLPLARMSSSAPAAAAPAATPVGSPTPHTKAYVEPDPVPHPTLNLLQGHPAGHCIQSSLFFASETWCTPLAADINTLLEGFAGAYTLASARAGEAEEGGERESPFEVFRRMWEEQGWSRVHLMGVPDGPRRRPWAESVLRGFLGEFARGLAAEGGAEDGRERWELGATTGGRVGVLVDAS